MSIAPTVVFHGQRPSTIVMQSTSQFDGTTAQTGTLAGGTLVMTPGLYVFAPQAGGGLYNFHDLVGGQQSITVLSISYKGGGTLTVSRKFANVTGSPTIQVGTVASAGELVFGIGELTLAPFEDLTLVSAGATTPIVAITAMLSSGTWDS